MSGAYLTLDDDYALQLDGGHATVLRTSDRIGLAALSRLEAVTVGLLDGRRREEEVLQTMRAVAGDIGHRAARTCLGRLRPLLARSQNPSAKDMPNLEELASVQAPDRRNGLRTLPGPRVLHWWVTNACPRRCVYCFANPDHSGTTENGLIPRERLNALFKEAASLGAEQLLVAGGEPFLRPDLPEVLGDAIAAGLAPAITTKFPITADCAKRLRRAGLGHLCLSVDSLRPDTNRRLIGSASVGPQFEMTVAALKHAGIAFSLEFVATSLNHLELEEVCEVAAALGARVLLVVPFEPVMHLIGPYSNNEMMVPPDADLPGRIAKLNAQYQTISVEAFEDIESKAEAPNCDIGKTKLFFDPFGRVHRCYKLLHDTSLFSADLRHVSIAAAWHDGAFNRQLLGERQNYAGTSCGICSKFESCHEDGRCIFQSQLDHKTYFDRDRACAGPY